MDLTLSSQENRQAFSEITLENWKIPGKGLEFYVESCVGTLYFYSDEKPKYLYLGLRNGRKIEKNIMLRNIVHAFDTKTSYKTFSAERKHWTLFCNMYASISNKIQQEIISKVRWCHYFLSYCF
jgi:hypothetical protein